MIVVGIISHPRENRVRGLYVRPYFFIYFPVISFKAGMIIASLFVKRLTNERRQKQKGSIQ